ncbi:Protein CBG10636 [Caenorhabditis briggsae]|uniref:Protein CBG10636 n=1 Tax=Caenorhabditis briggsae TaxID=6238 RepID=A8XBH9_CAEBR|nr:Protein CBG10636 [Caenorhabditis briggsae]CAP29994.1 Protein CBG10636 [Caenorhabditis briggsae]
MATPRHSGITKKDALAIVESCKARAAASSRRAQGTHCTEFQYSVLQARFAVKPLPNAREPSALSQAIGMTPKDSKTSRGLIYLSYDLNLMVPQTSEEKRRRVREIARQYDNMPFLSASSDDLAAWTSKHSREISRKSFK